MSKRNISFVEGEYYHIYNRGNSKQIIFIDDIDRDRFVKLMFLCNSKRDFSFRDDIIRFDIDAFDFERGNPIVAIESWVLMPNHFHLYITPLCTNLVDAKTKRELSAISIFMHKLTKAYASYFNTRHKRTGTLFEGKFKSVHVEDDIQAKYLFSYIHLNPVKLIQSDWKERGIVDVNRALEFLDKYKWSSYQDFIGKERIQSKIISPTIFSDYFPKVEKFKDEILDWITIYTKN